MITHGYPAPRAGGWSGLGSSHREDRKKSPKSKGRVPGKKRRPACMVLDWAGRNGAWY